MVTNYNQYIDALEKCAEEHKDDNTPSGNIDVSEMCEATANLLKCLRFAGIEIPVKKPEAKTMRISQVTEDAIIFDNGNKITFDHDQDCCEYNWADFSVVTPNVINYDFDFDVDLTFKFVENMGFLFGSPDENDNLHWIFVPCYSDQNGYYTTEIDIYYNDKPVLNGTCYERIDYD